MGARHAVQGIGRPESRSFGEGTNVSGLPDAVAVAGVATESGRCWEVAADATR